MDFRIDKKTDFRSENFLIKSRERKDRLYSCGNAGSAYRRKFSATENTCTYRRKRT